MGCVHGPGQKENEELSQIETSVVLAGEGKSGRNSVQVLFLPRENASSEHQKEKWKPRGHDPPRTSGQVKEVNKGGPHAKSQHRDESEEEELREISPNDLSKSDCDELKWDESEGDPGEERGRDRKERGEGEHERLGEWGIGCHLQQSRRQTK